MTALSHKGTIAHNLELRKQIYGRNRGSRIDFSRVSIQNLVRVTQLAKCGTATRDARGAESDFADFAFAV